MEALEELLKQSVEIIKQGGRLVVLTYHSLEDRIVKRFMRDNAKGEPYPRGVPALGMKKEPVMRLIGGAIRPSDKEVQANPRARSAIMRVAEKIA